MKLPLLEIPPLTSPGFETGPRSISAVTMLRISVTDRCNFRCVYCMPAEGMTWLGKTNLLTFDEIETIVRAAVDVYGITRFKLTGGEPTLRPGIVDLVARLRQIDKSLELSMTSNGMRLPDLAGPLKDAGLDRVTVSMDSLRPDRFREITRTGELATVLRGIDSLHAAGFESTKINCVTMRGVNADELADFAALTINQAVTVRFIEYMPLGDAAVMHTDSEPLRVSPDETGPAGGCGAQHRGDVLIPERLVREIIEAAHGPLETIDRATESGVGPAKVFRLSRGNPRGRVGFISAMSEPFCATCNRLRLTADGVLRSCLFDGGEVQIRESLRSISDSHDRSRHVAQAMSDCVRFKPLVHSAHGNEQMSRLGG